MIYEGEMMKDKCFGLVRVSSENQENNTSLNNQRQSIKKYCKYHDIQLEEVVEEVYRGYKYDRDSIQDGYFGINIHRSSAYKPSTYINKYSAGCQVFQDPDDFDEFMEICKKAAEVWGNKFTYTLLESKDII